MTCQREMMLNVENIKKKTIENPIICPIHERLRLGGGREKSPEKGSCKRIQELLCYSRYNPLPPKFFEEAYAKYIISNLTLMSQ